MINNVDGPTAAAQSAQLAVPQRPGEFGEGVGADAGLLAKNSGCGRGRARPITWPPSWVQARVRARIAVVLPRRQGRSQAAAGHPRCTSAGPVPPARYPGRVRFAAISSSASSTADSSTADPSRRPAAMTRRRSVDADPLRRVEVGADHGVDRRPVHAPQRLRFVNPVTWCGECHDRPSSTSSTSRSAPRHSPARQAPPRYGSALPSRGHAICQADPPSRPRCDRPSVQPSGRQRP